MKRGKLSNSSVHDPKNDENDAGSSEGSCRDRSPRFEEEGVSSSEVEPPKREEGRREREVSSKFGSRRATIGEKKAKANEGHRLTSSSSP